MPMFGNFFVYKNKGVFITGDEDIGKGSIVLEMHDEKGAQVSLTEAHFFTFLDKKSVVVANPIHPDDVINNDLIKTLVKRLNGFSIENKTEKIKNILEKEFKQPPNLIYPGIELTHFIFLVKEETKDKTKKPEFIKYNSFSEWERSGCTYEAAKKSKAEVMFNEIIRLLFQHKIQICKLVKPVYTQLFKNSKITQYYLKETADLLEKELKK